MHSSNGASLTRNYFKADLPRKRFHQIQKSPVVPLQENTHNLQKRLTWKTACTDAD